MIKTLIKRYPKLKKIFDYLMSKASIVEIYPISFVGWKMATGTRPPWLAGVNNEISREFNELNQNVLSLINDKRIYLTQFNQRNVSPEVKALSWRHYIVFWSVKYALRKTTCNDKKMAEFGVCDGLTAFFAAQAAKNECVGFYLYDAWEAMRGDFLSDSEKSSIGSYAYLSIENTKKNLEFTDYKDFVFNKGFIPEVFSTCSNPESLVWMHIDLNSSMPTIESLNFFWEKLATGGVVLFDDFAWPGYEDTQELIEAWCIDHKCLLLQLPTGQAIIFK